MKQIILLLIVAFIAITGCSQSSSQKNQARQQHVGGPCEGCEAIYESPVPFEQLSNLLWLPDWNDKGNKIAINGTVYNPDGTPAPGVVIYIYHTDQTGRYLTRGNEAGWGRRHGYLRGWMKTNDKGEYKFFTLKPAAYPGRKDPAHIHMTIKEPNKNEYYIDDIHFEDDPLLTNEMKKNFTDRGGSGILHIPEKYKGRNMIKSERNIYLGKNIPGYN